MRQAKGRGLAVSAGVTPAHFMLSDLATAEFRTFARLSPPLRSEDDREAVREAIVNAIAHRDYSIRGEGIRLLMFSDRLEVYSPGRLPGHVTLDNLKDERYSRRGDAGNAEKYAKRHQCANAEYAAKIVGNSGWVGAEFRE